MCVLLGLFVLWFLFFYYFLFFVSISWKWVCCKFVVQVQVAADLHGTREKMLTKLEPFYLSCRVKNTELLIADIYQFKHVVKSAFLSRERSGKERFLNGFAVHGVNFPKAPWMEQALVAQRKREFKNLHLHLFIFFCLEFPFAYY